MSTIASKHHSGRRPETHTPATHKPSSDAHAGDEISYFPKDPTDRVLALLGGPEAFRIRSPSNMAIISMLREGFPAPAADFLGTSIQTSTAELAKMLGTGTRVLARRRREECENVRAKLPAAPSPMLPPAASPNKNPNC